MVRSTTDDITAAPWHQRVLGRLTKRGRARVDVDQQPAELVALIPAHNEEDCIATCIDSLLAQTVVPDRIVVIADNCDDATADIARGYGAPVVVFETVDNDARKVGALSQGWLEHGSDATFVLGCDADSRLEPDCVELLLAEMRGNPAVGGVMARYAFDDGEADGFWARQLLRQQRMEFTGWTIDLLRRDRKTYVLGGQATLFRGEAMVAVAKEFRRESPWSTATQVEDMELTWRLNDLGWETVCSATARAWIGPMLTLRTLWAQRRKWDTGIIRLLRRDGFQEYTAFPWRLQAKMLLDSLIRVMFLVLFVVALSRDSWVWYWVWIIPPLFAAILNARIAWKMPQRTPADVISAVLIIPTEIYLVFRIGTWSRSWLDVLLSVRRDGWTAQYKAEGKTS